MLRRSTKIQLALFVIITLVGVSYVGLQYVGLGNGLLTSGGCTISADFPDSGGIFTNAEVTYRGVTVGRVGQLHLIDKGVRVDLQIKDCHSAKIPTDAAAQVSNRSVIGEQYVNLIPPDATASNYAGPYFTGGQIIPMKLNKLPIATQVLLTNLDNFVNSVNTTNLNTLITELGNAFADQGPALGALLDASSTLLAAAQKNWPDTSALIQKSSGVLDTQLAVADNVASWAHSLNLLSQQLKSSNGDIQNLLDNGPTDLAILGSFISDNRTDLGMTFSNLASTGQLLVRHRNGIEQLFELYPSLAAGTYTSLRPDGTGLLGFVVNSPNPADCGAIKSSLPREGYGGTKIRPPSDLSPIAPNTAAHCALAPSTGQNIRGVQNAPGGDPISTAGGQTAYPRVSTQSTIRVGTSADGSAAVLGDGSWMALLTDALH
ncbi:MAG: MCE family protein [Actinomycetota bacterium]|nr:MCE family protein [Actinomycetota bacterium]